MILPITAYGHPVLKRKASEVEVGYPGLGKLIDDMWETMYLAKGVGLAAPQINKSLRLFIVDASPYSKEENADPENLKEVFINPKIEALTGNHGEFEEGCLSIPGVHEYVSRPAQLKLTYRDANWNERTRAFEGMMARIIQHEYDHIEGKLFIEHLPNFKRMLLKGKLNDIAQGKIHTEYKMLFAPQRKKR